MSTIADCDSDRVASFRRFFAELITSNVGLGRDNPLAAAFASVPREAFLGPGPWSVFTRSGYLQTPSDDPALLYQDTTVAISQARQINNGQPVLHALCLGALAPGEGDVVVHIGAGTGYYTAVLSRLVGPTGSVFGYEIEGDLAERAAANLAEYPNVSVYNRSGARGPLPDSDIIYVNAGATGPLSVWLCSLRPGGRLLFPLTPAEVAGRPAPGAILLITKAADDGFDARFLCPAAFISCAEARDDETAARLTEAFARGDYMRVQSLKVDSQPDETCWCAGNGWWLSNAGRC